eukprot:TRINITY_DN33246_c0_g1_i1.p1 TRINITY_DN33246_c0_g1~~TRINITY_DN33246_c0_g1_i1.p1  ORF type:complete len:345 (-),score=56.66 TRINITY_DN33246_c0_g1_i1:178-1212(-)
MKAARERMKKALNISTSKKEEPKSIKETTESEVARLYKLHGHVMESTNAGMDVLYGTRLSDNHSVVIKTRAKPRSFKSAQEEREWRNSTTYQLNMPKVPTICELYEVLETNQKYYIVMEKVEGKDLFETMAEEKLSPGDSREIVKQILDALIALHNDGRIHKDIKIENVMVDIDSPKFSKSTRRMSRGSTGSTPIAASPKPADTPGEVKLIDFDTVQDWEPMSPKAKDVLGTDGYIAPEAYTGDYSPASDLYAVGVILYKLLTGKFPSRPEIFDDGPGENWVGSPAMKRIKERLRTEQMNFTLPPLDRIPEAADLCAKLLSYEAADRPTAEQARHHDFFLLELA